MEQFSGAAAIMFRFAEPMLCAFQGSGRMLQRKFLLSTEQISKDISYFTIGFATLSVQGNVEDAVCAASGTLVTVGSLHGILTAAHVLGNLPTKGQVGLVTHADDPTRFQKQVIMMEHTDSVVMRGKAFDQKGPDLGFLRLPQQSIGWIAAKNSFYNLRKHRDDVLAGGGASGQAERTTHQLLRDFLRRQCRGFKISQQLRAPLL
jgi:hypothetical protein